MSQPPYDPQPGTDPYQQPAPQAQQPYPQQGYPQQGGSGGGFFPFPHKSWRTSRGTQVTVGGCCLPLPLGCLTTLVAAGVVAATKVASARR